MIRTLGIPVLNRGDLLLRCVESIDHPIETLFIINNGGDKGVKEATERIASHEMENSALFDHVRIEHNENRGCGPSWNWMVVNSPGPWLLVNNDIKFYPGTLAKIDDAQERLAIEDPCIGVICALGYSTFLLTKLCFDKIGLFDENFFPAYFEDCDFDYRVKLGGMKKADLPGDNCLHGEPPYYRSSTVNSDRVLARKVQATFVNLKKYYISKWGGEPLRERFKTPFNNGKPSEYWEINLELRKANTIR